MLCNATEQRTKRDIKLKHTFRVQKEKPVRPVG